LTSIFFSISPEDYERNLKDEIWGCFKYIGIPLDTVMNMPIQDRKYFIMRHNAEQEEMKRRIEGDNDIHDIGGEAINTFAQRTRNDPLMQR
jgi:hypothetical protein